MIEATMQLVIQVDPAAPGSADDLFPSCRDSVKQVNRTEKYSSRCRPFLMGLQEVIEVSKTDEQSADSMY